MPKYRATLQVSGISGDSPRSVRSALDEQLRKSGLENYRVVRVDVDAPPPRADAPHAIADDGPSWRRETNTGGLLLVAAVAWALWFFWWMLSGAAE